MKRALITAGASGIGCAMAEAFEAEGHEVWVTDVDQAALDSCPRNWTARHADVSSDADMKALFDDLAAAGGIDIVCANAGVAGPTAAVEDVTWDDWQACVNVTLGGAFLTAKYASPLMKAAGAGAIIVTSSTAGVFGYPNRAPYGAAKWGVIGLMKTLAMELGPYGIRANAICPGAVEWPRMEEVLARDIADMAVFLASERARRVSGQVISVDGHTENPDPKP